MVHLVVLTQSQENSIMKKPLPIYWIICAIYVWIASPGGTLRAGSEQGISLPNDKFAAEEMVQKAVAARDYDIIAQALRFHLVDVRQLAALAVYEKFSNAEQARVWSAWLKDDQAWKLNDRDKSQMIVASNVQHLMSNTLSRIFGQDMHFAQLLDKQTRMQLAKRLDEETLRIKGSDNSNNVRDRSSPLNGSGSTSREHSPHESNKEIDLNGSEKEVPRWTARIGFLIILGAILAGVIAWIKRRR